MDTNAKRMHTTPYTTIFFAVQVTDRSKELDDHEPPCVFGRHLFEPRDPGATDMKQPQGRPTAPNNAPFADPWWVLGSDGHSGFGLGRCWAELNIPNLDDESGSGSLNLENLS